jgi:hypothetical protein
MGLGKTWHKKLLLESEQRAALTGRLRKRPGGNSLVPAQQGSYVHGVRVLAMQAPGQAQPREPYDASLSFSQAMSALTSGRDGPAWGL